MKLYKFVNEYKEWENTPKGIETRDEMDRIVEIIKKDCQPFLKEFGTSVHNPIYRGSNKDMYPEHFMKVRSRRKRKPKDMPSHIHNLLDELFLKHHGWKARSEGTFVTHNRSDAGNYGWQVLFYPKGKYQYLWNEDVDDLYQSIRTEVTYNVPGMDGNQMTRHLSKEDIDNPEFRRLLDELVANYENKGYNKVIGARNEAMFKTWEYYMVAFDSRREDQQFLTKLDEAV